MTYRDLESCEKIKPFSRLNDNQICQKNVSQPYPRANWLLIKLTSRMALKIAHCSTELYA